MRRRLAMLISVLAMAMPVGAAAQSSPDRGEPADARARFDRALEAGDAGTAARLAESVLRSGGGSAALLDEVTYRLASAGASGAATRLLLGAYPFAQAAAPTRELLAGRLFHLLHEVADAPGLDAGELERLRTPLDTAALRSLQGVFWALRGDCPAVAGVLRDLSSEYGHDDLVRLGHCTRESSPLTARDAYARAHAMQPGGPGSRALAHHAHSRGEYRTAVDTWRAAGVERLPRDDLRAAVTSAIAAEDAQQAGVWIDALTRASDRRDHDADTAALLMDLGYLHLRDDERRAARRAFEQAWSIARVPAAAEQLVYLTQQLRDNAAARTYAKHAIDVREDARPRTESREVREWNDRLFGFRRLHEDLGRRVTVNLDGWSGPRSGSTISASQPGRVFSSYTQLEVDYRLGRQTIRNGTTVSIFSRLIADGGSPGSPWPTDNATLGAGVRWKPFGSQVLYLAAEAQSGLEHRDYRDVLLRASASLFNGAHGDDWHPSGTGWFAQNLYLDAAHYVDAARTGLTADYRTSYHGKAASNQTWEPYAHFQASGLRAGAFQHDLRGGLGVRWNLWFGASRYDAPAHKLSLGVEYQEAFDTYLADRRGVFFTLGSRW